MEYTYPINQSLSPDFDLTLMQQQIDKTIPNNGLSLSDAYLTIMVDTELSMQDKQTLDALMQDQTLGLPIKNGTYLVLSEDPFQIADFATQATGVKAYIVFKGSFGIQFETQITPEQIQAFLQGLSANIKVM